MMLLRTMLAELLLLCAFLQTMSFQESTYIGAEQRKMSLSMSSQVFGLETQSTQINPTPKASKVGPTTSQSERWNSNFDRLVAFKEEFGHCNVPQHPTSHIKKEYPQLASFCRNIRQQYRYLQADETRHRSFLSEDRIRQLESIGFFWSAHDAQWRSKFEELVEFYDQHGHCNVPKDWDKNPSLKGWISYQRTRYNQKSNKYKPLSETQIKLLESIEFRWTPKDEIWWSNLEELKKHKEKHGTFRTSCPTLRQWQNNLRKACREYVIAASIDGSTDAIHVHGLNEQRLEALREVRFCWLPKSAGPLEESPPNDIFAGFQ